MSDSDLFDFLPALPAFSFEPPVEAPVIYTSASSEAPTKTSVYWVDHPVEALSIEIEIRRKP